MKDSILTEKVTKLEYYMDGTEKGKEVTDLIH